MHNWLAIVGMSIVAISASWFVERNLDGLPLVKPGSPECRVHMGRLSIYDTTLVSSSSTLERIRAATDFMRIPVAITINADYRHIGLVDDVVADSRPIPGGWRFLYTFWPRNYMNDNTTLLFCPANVEPYGPLLPCMPCAYYN